MPIQGSRPRKSHKCSKSGPLSTQRPSELMNQTTILSGQYRFTSTNNKFREESGRTRTQNLQHQNCPPRVLEQQPRISIPSKTCIPRKNNRENIKYKRKNGKNPSNQMSPPTRSNHHSLVTFRIGLGFLRGYIYNLVFWLGAWPVWLVCIRVSWGPWSPWTLH